MSFLDLPARKHLVHKPCEWRNLSESTKELLGDFESSDWIWQVKYDGCHGIVVVHAGDAHMFSREGNRTLSCDHITRQMKTLPEGAYFGEVYNGDMQFPEISGLFRKQSSGVETSRLEYKLFDYVPYREFMCGVDNVCYEARWQRLLQIYENHVGPLKNIAPAYSFTYTPENHERAEQGLKQLRSFGHHYGTDGYVAKRKGGDWTAGDGKKGQQIKVKDHMSVDLLCLGLVEGKGKFAGMTGALVVEWQGKPVQVSGGRLTTKERELQWEYSYPPRHPCSMIGKIVEVHALGLTPDGQLREPRFQRIRHDKTEPSV